jgi:hypothetical protein
VPLVVFTSEPRGKQARRRWPARYAPLAYLLEKSGFRVEKTFATKGSDLEKTMKAEGQAWLAS